MSPRNPDAGIGELNLAVVLTLPLAFWALSNELSPLRSGLAGDIAALLRLGLHNFHPFIALATIVLGIVVLRPAVPWSRKIIVWTVVAACVCSEIVIRSTQ